MTALVMVSGGRTPAQLAGPEGGDLRRQRDRSAALVGVTSQVASVPAGQGLAWTTLPFASPLVLPPGTYWLGNHTGAGGTAVSTGYVKRPASRGS